MFTMDAGMAFLVSQLAYLEKKVFEVLYQNIIYPRVIPITMEAGEHVTSIEYIYTDKVGIAKFIGPKSLDVPMVETSMDKETIPVEYGAVGFEYALEELRQATALGVPLTTRKMNNARRAFEELAQRVYFTGDTEHGLPGFLNNANVPAASVVNPGSGTQWVNKTADEILFDINDLLSDVNVDTNQVESANTLALPTAQWNYIAATPRATNSDTSILSYVVKNSPFLNSPADIIKINELAGAGAAGADRMMAYTKDPDKVVGHMPMNLRFRPPQPKGLGFEVPGEFKLAGVEFRYPLSAKYADGI